MDSELTLKLKKFSLSKNEKSGISLSESDIFSCKEEGERSLFGKIFGGKKANLSGLKHTISSIWQVKNPFTIRELGFNFFQFVFDDKEDKMKVFQGKLWSFENQYLILKEGGGEGTPCCESFNQVELWVHIWNLPNHWICAETGLKVGKMFSEINDVVCYDSGGPKGRFIRILVKVNLEEQLSRATFISLGKVSVWIDFKYERLLGFCFYCGRVGHNDRICEFMKEDIQKDKLKEGQFGEWLRGDGFASMRNGKGQNYSLKKNSHKTSDAQISINDSEDDLKEHTARHSNALVKNISLSIQDKE